MTERRALRLGSRGSELALWQARHVAERLEAGSGGVPCELVSIRTAGDQIPDLPLHQVEGRAFFSREIEQALASGEIDLAVHSLKDLATAMPEGLTLGAVLPREDPRDVLLTPPGVDLDLDRLASGARVGTSSLRRRALLARWRPDLELLDLRGNVPTRLRALDEGRFDAIVLAAAGIKRLGLGERARAWLPVERFLPAVGQGAIAVQVRAEAAEVVRRVADLDDAATRAAVTAERALLARLEGGCQVPLGALAEVHGGRLELAAIVCSLDGKVAIEGTRVGDPADPGGVGEALAEELLRRGAGEILAAIRRLPSAAS